MRTDQSEIVGVDVLSGHPLQIVRTHHFQVIWKDEVREKPALQIVLRHPHDLRHPVVGKNDRALLGYVDGLVRLFDQGPVLLLALAESLFGLLALGDIPRDAEGPERPAMLVDSS